MIEKYSKRDPSATVPFPTHVTLVGGFPCRDLAFLKDVILPRLENALKDSPSVTCTFLPEPVFAPQWNQAAVLVLDQSTEFTKLVQTCREVLSETPTVKVGGDPNKQQLEFPPPLRHPHMSLFYGMGGVPEAQEIIDDLGGPTSLPFSFVGTQVAIWKTYPTTVEGVAQWRELAAIHLQKTE